MSGQRPAGGPAASRGPGGHGLPVIEPMLATPGPLPANPGFGFEFKFDGCRAVISIDGPAVRVRSRTGRDATATYPELAAVAAVLGAKRQVVLDGEIVALDEAGLPDFEALQSRIPQGRPGARLLARVPVHFYAFDVLYLDGRSLLRTPYAERREVLAGLELVGGPVATPPYFPEAGEAVMAAARQTGHEGVVAKTLGGLYLPGRRSRAWIKTVIRKQEVLTVGGFTGGTGRHATTIGSLLVGVRGRGGQLQYVGHVGTGFTEADRRHLLGLLMPLLRPDSPFSTQVSAEYARAARWVEPVVDVVVEIRQWTRDGRLRHPSWIGLASTGRAKRRLTVVAQRRRRRFAHVSELGFHRASGVRSVAA